MNANINERRNLLLKAKYWEDHKRQVCEQLRSIRTQVASLQRYSVTADLDITASNTIKEAWALLQDSINLAEASRMPRYLMNALSDEMQRIQDDRLRLLGDLSVDGTKSVCADPCIGLTPEECFNKHRNKVCKCFHPPVASPGEDNNS